MIDITLFDGVEGLSTNMLLGGCSQTTLTRRGTVCLRILYTPVKGYVVKQPQEKWACDFHDDAPPLSFQLQVTEDFF